MRFVAIKSEEQQVVSQGVPQLRRRLPDILENAENGLPPLAQQLLNDLLDQLRAFDQRIGDYDVQISELAKSTEAARRLMALEGVGPITATAMVAAVGDARVFKSGRQFAAWLGLTPRQNSSGGNNRLGRMTKRGDAYLRTLLIHGARALLCYVGRKSDPKSLWAGRLLQRRHRNVAAVALAAKQARIIWAMLARGTEYQPSVACPGAAVMP